MLQTTLLKFCGYMPGGNAYSTIQPIASDVTIVHSRLPFWVRT